LGASTSGAKGGELRLMLLDWEKPDTVLSVSVTEMRNRVKVAATVLAFTTALPEVADVVIVVTFAQADHVDWLSVEVERCMVYSRIGLVPATAPDHASVTCVPA
jgi:hypothetical protein